MTMNKMRFLIRTLDASQSTTSPCLTAWCQQRKTRASSQIHTSTLHLHASTLEHVYQEEWAKEKEGPYGFRCVKRVRVVESRVCRSGFLDELGVGGEGLMVDSW